MAHSHLVDQMLMVSVSLIRRELIVTSQSVRHAVNNCRMAGGDGRGEAERGEGTKKTPFAFVGR